MNKDGTLKEFAIFLLNASLLEKVAKYNIKLLRIHHEEIIKNLGNLKEEELYILFKKYLGKFLQDVSEEKGVDNILNSYEIWENNNYGLTNAKILPADIMLAFEIRKDALIKMIPLFTGNPEKNLALREALHALFLIAHKTGMNIIKKQ
jgi:hypothetical protein